MAKIHTANARAVRAAQRTAWRACAPEPRKQGICSTLARRKSFARADACDMLRAESLAAESIFRGIFPTRSRVMAKKGGAPTKSEIVAQICKDSDLSRKQVAAVFESLNGIITKSLRGPGLFTLPGLLKMKVVKKPATKAREGINPFTKEKMVFKAKPASKKVRVLPLKSLKALVN
jgi:nucleoid DNA-binding protein